MAALSAAIQYRITNTVFSNNILYRDIAKGGQFNLFIVHWNTTGSGNTFNHNLHYGPGTPVWVMKNQWREGWTAYANDASSGPAEQWGNPSSRIPRIRISHPERSRRRLTPGMEPSRPMNCGIFEGGPDGMGPLPTGVPSNAVPLCLHRTRCLWRCKARI